MGKKIKAPFGLKLIPSSSITLVAVTFITALLVVLGASVGSQVALAHPDDLHKTGADHAADDLVNIPISTVEQETNSNKTTITKQKGVQPGAARSQQIGNAAPTMLAAVSADPGVSGQWSAVIGTQVVPVFQAVLPNGKILMWDSVGDNATETYPNQTFTRAIVWNSVDNTFKRVDVANYNIFCAGFAHLPNGNIFVAGGNKDMQLSGIVQTHIFNWQTETWSRGPNMASERWYPTVVPMSNGEEVIVGGGPAIPEAYQTQGTLRALSNLSDSQYGGRLYPWVQMRPDTLLDMIGPYTAMHTANTSGTGALISTGYRDNMLRDYGSFARYDIGKTLIAGGGILTEGGQNYVATKTAEVINSNGNGLPTVTPTSSMSAGRRQFNTTVLADGSVLATGGQTTSASSSLVDLNNAVTSAERWDPVTGTWKVLSSANRIRQYHSTATLLPDGRVLTGGGGICSDCTTSGYIEKNIEYFSPPYLFKNDGSGTLAARPIISAAPSSAPNSLTFTLSVANTHTSFKKIALVGLSDVTHGVNQSQQYIPLKYSITGTLNGATNVSISGPVTGTVIAPGYYMLFVVDNNNVPSVAKIIKVAQAADPQMKPLQNAASYKCLDVPGASTVSATYLWTYHCNGSAAQSLNRIDFDNSIRIQGNCIDVPNFNFVSGQRLWAYSCNNQNTQKWQFRTDGTIRPIANQSLCMTTASLDNGGELIISTCNGSAIQKWNLNVVKPPKPYESSLQNATTYRCVDVPNGNTNSGVYLWSYDCNGTAAQILSRYDSNNSIHVQGNCIDVPGANFKSGQRVWTYTCNGTPAQQWNFNMDGTVRPVAALTMCLTPISGDNASQLIISECNGGEAQKWNTTISAPPKPYQSPVRNVAANRCLDVPGATTASGTKLWIYDCNGTAAQSITRVDFDRTIRMRGNCLDVPNYNFVSGQWLWAYACNALDTQRWQFNTDGTIRPIATQGLCLAAMSVANGAQLVVATCSGSTLQKWTW